jgi:hypothetical protein
VAKPKKEVEEIESTEAAGAAETVEAPAIEIIRGRMPLAIVHQIRFSEPEDVTDAELAAKYRTTNGKISDVRKNRNFAYLTKDDVFSEDELHAAANFADKLSGTDADDVNEAISKMVVGSPEQLAARDETRKASRKPRGAESAVAAGVTTDGDEENVTADDVGDVDDLGDADMSDSEDLSDLID